MELQDKSYEELVFMLGGSLDPFENGEVIKEIVRRRNILAVKGVHASAPDLGTRQVEVSIIFEAKVESETFQGVDDGTGG